MTDDDRGFGGGIERRRVLAAGAAALAMGLAANTEILAQATLAPTAQPPSAKPGTVTLERRDNVLLIAIDRPQAQNRLDPPILTGLGKAFYQLDHDDALRVGVLHGVGPDFCVGADLPALVAALAAGTFPPKDPDFVAPLGLQPPYRIKPVVVAVQGATKFGGHELFLAQDIRVAAADTVFSQGEVTRATFPSGGGTVRFPREVGWGNAMRYMLTGEEWGAQEAYRLGLVQEVVPNGKQLDRAIELATKIAAAAPLGVRATLASSRQALAAEEATAYAALTPVRAHLAQSEDAKEAQRAFQQGRKPAFRGL
jgi:enoyl-CoA hydratase/carnithine racemase